MQGGASSAVKCGAPHARRRRRNRLEPRQVPQPDRVYVLRRGHIGSMFNTRILPGYVVGSALSSRSSCVILIILSKCVAARRSAAQRVANEVM